MNERIKENWEKATGSAIPGPGFFASASDYNIEKFAELIVRECIAQCEKNVDHEYLGWGSKLSAFNIKQHFGVEE